MCAKIKRVAGVMLNVLMVATVAATEVLGGCASTGTAPAPGVRRQQRLLHILTDVSDSAEMRQKADRQLVQMSLPSNPARLAALVEVVGGYGQSPTMKIYAMDQLMAANRQLAIAVLARQIPHFEHWRVLRYACSLTVRIGDQALVDPLVLSLNRTATRFTTRQRPEADAIRHLTHGSLRSCLEKKFRHGQMISVRLAALNLLYHLLPTGRLRELVLAGTNDDAMLSSLAWYARLFSYVPHTAPQVAWIEEMHSGAMGPVARAAKWDMRYLPGHCMENGVPPRLVGLLATLGRPTQYPPIAMLRQRVRRAYAAHRHVRRPGPYPGSPDNPDPSLAANAGKFSYLDWLVIRVLYDALHHEAFRDQIMRLGRQSRHVHGAEQGGLIQFHIVRGQRESEKYPAIHLKLYPSLKNVNSGVYITGPQLLLDTPMGLGQFILHFQKRDNERYTGPAPGDLRYVRFTRCVVVIFTSMSRRAFDTTVDFPSGAVLDLGVARVRPVPRSNLNNRK